MPNYDTSKNWITSLPGPITTNTDNNGQMTYDGVHNYTWDAEHKVHSVDANPASCSTSGECLTYDALGRMVEKTVGSTYTQIVYGPGGRFAIMNGQTFVSAFIPLPGSQAVYTSASLNTTNKVAYDRHTDHLGSSRLATTPTQTLYSSTAYAPCGEPYSQAGATDLSFTGQEQDTVSGIYDFPARKYPPVQGRWLSPDPAGLAAANPANPQSWNRYAYVLNNPLSLVDPLGLDPCDTITGMNCWGPYDPSRSSPGVGASQNPDLAGMTGSGGTGNGGCDSFCMMDGGDVIYKDTNTERNVTIQNWFDPNWSPWDYEYKGNYFDNINDLFAFEVQQFIEQQEAKEKECPGIILQALQETKHVDGVQVGDPFKHGGAININVMVSLDAARAAGITLGGYGASRTPVPGGGGSLHTPTRGFWDPSAVSRQNTANNTWIFTVHLDSDQAWGSGGLWGAAKHLLKDVVDSSDRDPCPGNI